MSKPEMDHPLERMVFFSDAVFAIVITLLVIEIDVPDLAPGTSNAEAWRELGSLGYSFAAFVLSFLVIGRFWIGHHRLFCHVTGYDKRLLWPNLLFLMGIALMPFATAFFGRNIGHFVPALVYDLTMLACALLNLRLVHRAAKIGLLDIDERQDEVFSHAVAVVLASALAAGLAFLTSQWSQLGLATILLWTRLLRRKDQG